MSEQTYTAKIEVGHIVIHDGVRYRIDKIVDGYIVASALIGRDASTEVIEVSNDSGRKLGTGRQDMQTNKIYDNTTNEGIEPENHGGHCWHRHNEHHKGPDNISGPKEYVCCKCGDEGIISWSNDRAPIPDGHGKFYPTETLKTGQWVFSSYCSGECKPTKDVE